MESVQQPQQTSAFPLKEVLLTTGVTSIIGMFYFYRKKQTVPFKVCGVCGRGLQAGMGVLWWCLLCRSEQHATGGCHLSLGLCILQCKLVAQQA